MDSITIGQISLVITFIVGLITGISYLHKSLKDWIAKSLKDQLDAIDHKISGVQTTVDDVDKNATKNFLVSTLSGIEKGQPLDEIERERFFEQYEHYSKIGGNGYVKAKVDQLRAEGKL